MTFGKTGPALLYGKSAQNYVQDGLIMMYDAIENAGFGVHDYAATTWKDLSKNNFDLVVDLSGVEWHGNYMRPISKAANCVYRENAQRELAALKLVPTTIECVFYNPTVGDYRILANLTFQKRYNCLAGGYGTTNFGMGTALRKVVTGKTIAMSASIASTLVNGEDAGNITSKWGVSGTGRAYNDISLFGVRYPAGSPMYPISCALHTIRVYSRDLSTQERLANYAIDVERFNSLGGGEL